MNLTAAYSDTDVNQAALLSKLSGRPAHVRDDVFVWNGKLVDRASAVVALLKVYNQVPVSGMAKSRLYTQYAKKFAHVYPSLTVTPDTEKHEIWFYKLCKEIKGEISERSNEEIKQILISLHAG